MLHIVTTRPWKAERLGARLHAGSDALDTARFIEGEDAAWMPASHASLHWAQSTDGWGFQDAIWWHLPQEVLGRKVVHGTAETIAELLDPGVGFVKLARHKYDYFPAKVRTLAYFRHDLGARPWLPLHEFVLSELLEIEAEYRVWIADGQVLYGCSYPVDGDRAALNQGIAPSDVLARAGDVAQCVSGALAVDVAKLRSGRTVVVETNPVWCAGFLTAPREVLATGLLASQGRENVVDRYVPDAAVRLMLASSDHNGTAPRPSGVGQQSR